MRYNLAQLLSTHDDFYITIKEQESLFVDIDLKADAKGEREREKERIAVSDYGAYDVSRVIPHPNNENHIIVYVSKREWEDKKIWQELYDENKTEYTEKGLKQSIDFVSTTKKHIEKLKLHIKEIKSGKKTFKILKERGLRMETEEYECEQYDHDVDYDIQVGMRGAE